MRDFALGRNLNGPMEVWQDAQNERSINVMLLMGKRVTTQGNELKTSLVRRCSMLSNAEGYTRYKLQHDSKQVRPLIFPHSH